MIVNANTLITSESLVAALALAGYTADNSRRAMLHLGYSEGCVVPTSDLAVSLGGRAA